ncbi:glycosyl hydrolase [Arthrobacter sp. Sa2BUA2]|uniref:Glycosyl hydrolase n=1 Tax=Arthrobacter pullicola TaxID=2762224 RepID=A0ABR8YL25_9MICC|nr:glycoside hydrolase family 76 protein [Arthrobacter pullicola]MBD8044847.1 glycosyl hydrolase [Arthrobacter pullicola]
MPAAQTVRNAELRADTAAQSVTTAFGGRLFNLPGTHLGAVRAPHPLPRGAGPWHYWWQAHYVDLLVDTGLRSRATLSGKGFSDVDPIRLADVLIRTIRLRNGGRITNNFYDDMAWLALASLRVDSLPGPPRGTKPRHQRLRESLGSALRSAHTQDFGGGLFWDRSRTFKNTPATAPAALFFARGGDRDRAQALIDWLNTVLLDPDTGLYFDGVRMEGTRLLVETPVYTYNQGPVLGALLELGGPANLARATELVQATAAHLVYDDDAGYDDDAPLLRTHGSGDGGLFTGILCRYLAEAAAAPTLDLQTRHLAGTLVTELAERLWKGRATRNNLAVFSADPRRTADESYPAGAGVELSTQLQAWMVLEASVRVARLDTGPAEGEESA